MKTRLTTLIVTALVGATAAFAHSKAIKPEFVDKLLEPYFELQDALASDDLAAAKESASSFKEMLGQGPSQKEAPSLTDLSEEADKIAGASDLSDARSAFHAISKDLTSMVEHVGTAGKQDVFEMRCPMAFDNKGGSWLQNNDDLANPYYGSKMRNCGSVQGQVAKGKMDGHGAHGKMKGKMKGDKAHGDDHQGHNH